MKYQHLTLCLIDNFRWVTFIALILIAIGTGGIKPCVSAFGADQFKDDQVSILVPSLQINIIGFRERSEFVSLASEIEIYSINSN